MANWPATVPTPLFEGAQYAPGKSNVIRTEMAVAVDKVRRRSTAAAKNFTGKVRLTETQVATLETFYFTTLKEVLPFDWIDFRTVQSGPIARSYRFRSQPSYVPAGPGRWDATIELEMMP